MLTEGTPMNVRQQQRRANERSSYLTDVFPSPIQPFLQPNFDTPQPKVRLADAVL